MSPVRANDSASAVPPAMNGAVSAKNAETLSRPGSTASSIAIARKRITPGTASALKPSVAVIDAVIATRHAAPSITSTDRSSRPRDRATAIRPAEAAITQIPQLMPGMGIKEYPRSKSRYRNCTQPNHS
jgi:hypothetical protein